MVSARRRRYDGELDERQGCGENIKRREGGEEERKFALTGDEEMAVRTSVSAEDSERSGSQTRLVRRRRPGHRYCRVTRKYLASLQNGDCYVLAEQRLYELILVCHLHICTVLIRNKAVLMFIIVLLISAIIFTPAESNKYLQTSTST